MSFLTGCLGCSAFVFLLTSVLFFVVSLRLINYKNNNELIIKENYIVCTNRAKFENTVKNLIDFDTKHYGSIVHNELNNKLFFQNFGSEDICLSKYIFDDIRKLDKTIAKSIRNDLEILELLLRVTNVIIANENNKTTVQNEKFNETIVNEIIVNEIIVKDVLDESANVIEL